MTLSYTTLAVTVGDADTYITARAYTGWPASSDDKTAALRRGQDYIAREYNERWSDEWENADAPEIVQFAIYEAALVEAVTPGVLSPVKKASDAKILTGVDTITWTPIPGPGGVEALRPRLLHVEAMLAGVVSGGKNTIFLERA